MSEKIKRLLKVTLGISAFSLFCWCVVTFTELQQCASESLKGVHYLLTYKTNPIKRGDIVSIKGHEVSYFKQFSFAKRVVGLPGDRVVKGRNAVKIEPASLEVQDPISLTFLKTTKKGEVLTPLTTMIIPEGYVFVAGDHPRSFDSRYEEFGLVPMDKIWGKALLVW